MSTRHIRNAVAASAAVTLMFATGCAASDDDAEATPSETSAPTASQTTPTETTPPASETPDPTGEAGAVVLPGCDTILSAETIESLSEGAEELPQFSEQPATEVMPGPAAVEAAEAATETKNCGFGVPNSDSGVLSVVTAELPTDAKDTFIATLEEDGFSEITVDGSTGYIGPGEEHGLSGELANVVYGFEGNVWVTVHGYLDEEDIQPIADEAMANVLAANS